MPAPGHGRAATSWWGTSVPTTSISPGFDRWIGAEFSPVTAGRIFGVRVYGLTTRPGGAVWLLRVNGIPTVLAAVAAQNYSGASPRWLQAWIHPVIKIPANQVVEVYTFFDSNATSYYTPNGAGTGVIQGGLKNIGGQYFTVINPLVTQNPTFISSAEGVDVLFQSN